MYLMTTENEILPCVKQKVGSTTAVSWNCFMMEKRCRTSALAHAEQCSRLQSGDEIHPINFKAGNILAMETIPLSPLFTTEEKSSSKYTLNDVKLYSVLSQWEAEAERAAMLWNRWEQRRNLG